MKRIVILTGIFLTCLVQITSAQTPDHKKALRQQLMHAVNNSKTTDSLYNSLATLTNKSPLITGYIGTLQALKAKHHWNPYYKIKYVRDAEKTFAKAVTAEPHDIEIRFLRYSVEHNLPKFLGYSKNMKADRDEMLSLLNKHYPADEKQMVITIINYLLEADKSTNTENNYLTKQLATLQ